jgi:hypothetical protein
MSKQQKTASELEDLIRDQALAAGIQCFVKVAKDPTHGWHATALADPRVVIDYQSRGAAYTV